MSHHATAIFFHPEAYTTSGAKLMGRNAAGESFLRGYLTHSQAAEFWVQVQQLDHARDFAAIVQAAGRDEAVRVVNNTNLAALSQPGVVYYPGPGIGLHAWQRGLAGPNGHASWSLCGITHTTSSAVAMDSLAELLTAPVQPWDAVICTSNAVKNNVERLLQAQEEYLKERLGVTRMVLPQLPVIPLGIHTQDFAFTEDQKAQARQTLGADRKTHVVLYVGRLSFHAKAHPLAMYQALEIAARQLPADERLLLVECGWHANDHLRIAFADAARQACPSVQLLTLDGRNAQERQTAWAGADIFCSLSDNIQETFGIVPIEAMAAGLPVVVSDWDGYKDSVRHGIDGFRLPTMMPQPGLGTDLALRHALEIDSYDMYCGHTSSLVAVDVAATANAFQQLFASPGLRQQMGQAGRQRARELYDWKTVIARYEELWAHLRQIRETGGRSFKPVTNPWPARLDPFYSFTGYPTQLLTPQSILGLVDANADTALERVRGYRQLAMVNYARIVLPDEEEVQAMVQSAATKPRQAAEFVAGFPAERQPYLFRALSWLLKLGIIKLLEPATTSMKKILFIHQNFPGQFKFLAPALLQQGHEVMAMTMQKVTSTAWQGVRLVPYGASRSSTPGIHPWLIDFETKTIRAEACFRAALQLKAEGYTPDIIIAHPGWGETLFLKEVWPEVAIGIYCEFYYHQHGADVGFDPEFPAKDEGDVCRLRLKNLNNLLQFEIADAGISPTRWQASTFPEPFRSKITVVHDGIDTKALAPNPQVSLKLASSDGGGELRLTRQDEVITFVNRNLEPYRGYHTFMRALPELLKRRPNARILIVGGDKVSYGARPDEARYGATTWKEVYVNEVRGHIGDADWSRVHFLGHLPYNHFILLLQLSTIHVYLTYPFVLSWSLLEAMSVGCAIVASDTQPLQEAVIHDQTGRLVNFFDHAALASELCALLDDPQARERLGQQARAFAQANYDLQTVCLPRQMEWVTTLIEKG
jgi:glycosyltransferase involved in cell wall biosynthesis